MKIFNPYFVVGTQSKIEFIFIENYAVLVDVVPHRIRNKSKFEV